MAYPFSDEDQRVVDRMWSALRGGGQGVVCIRVLIPNPASESELRQSHAAYLFLGEGRSDSDADAIVRVPRGVAEQMLALGAIGPAGLR